MVVLSALVLAGCSAPVTSGATSIGPDGGEAALADDPAVRLVVPPGGVIGSVDVSLTSIEEAPPPEPGTTLIGRVVDVSTTGPVAGGRVVLPLDLQQVGPSWRRDFFIAVFSESLRVWVPLPTDADAAATSASAVAPHYSRFGLFGYDIPGAGAAGDALAWTKDTTGELAHDTWGGVKNFARGIGDGLTNWWEGGERKEPDCRTPVSGWTVSSTAQEFDGCVVDSDGLELRLGNRYRLPLTVRGPTGTGIGLTGSDYELGMIDLVMRLVNGSAGLGSVAPRGTTALGVPAEHFAGELELTVSRARPLVLGWKALPAAEGFGRARPTIIDFGGGSTAVIDDVVWSSWGGDTAEAVGTAAYVPPGVPNAYAVREQARIIASDPGECRGQQAYRKLTWFFPQHGQTGDYVIDICADW